MTGLAGSPGTYRAALGNRSFRLALESYTLAAVAQGAWTVALAVALYDQTGSALWAAVAACTRLLPYLLLSPVAGVLADRWGHRRILEAATTARILLAIGVTAGIAVTAPPGLLAVVAFLATAAATPVYPALNAFVPTAVPSTDLAAANSLLSTTETLGWIAGPGHRWLPGRHHLGDGRRRQRPPSSWPSASSCCAGAPRHRSAAGWRSRRRRRSWPRSPMA